MEKSSNRNEIAVIYRPDAGVKSYVTYCDEVFIRELEDESN